MSAITNTAIRAMQPGAVLKDDVVPGLQLRFTGRRKTFYLYYRTKAGVERRPKLGHWGAITLVQAREAARVVLTRVAAGEDPGADIAAARLVPTVIEFFEKLHADRWSTRKTAAEVRRRFEQYAKPKLGTRRMTDSGRALHAEVKALHAGMAAAPYQANRVLADLHTLFNVAALTPYKARQSNDNPCDGIVRYPERKRKRKAEPHELAAIGPLLEREAQDPRNSRSVAHLYLLGFSGARPEDIAKARPEQLSRVELDGLSFGVLEVPDGKGGQETVFLPPQAMAVIDRLPVVAGQTITGIKSPKKLWEKIRRAAGCPDLRMRDWRRTFASIALSNDVPIGQVGELLNHKSAQTTKIYALLLQSKALGATAITAAALERMLGYTGKNLVDLS